ncbi:hypothetical protein EWW49_33685, partial [Pseudomonas syringae]
ECDAKCVERRSFRRERVRDDGARYWCMMSSHHAVLDAWCRSLRMNDLFGDYTALGEGRDAQLAPAPRYRDYIGWLHRRGLTQARDWWRDNLRGFERPTPIPSDRPFLREHAGARGGLVVGDCRTPLPEHAGARPREPAPPPLLPVHTSA